MTDSPFNPPASEDVAVEENHLEDEVPQFGVVDIVEAFTAMRHEWRGQTKESRAVAEQIDAATTNLQQLEAKLLAQVSDARRDDSEEAKNLALLIAEIDHQWTRAVAASEQSEQNKQLRGAEETAAIERYFANMSILGRWYSRPLLTFFNQKRQTQEPGEEQGAIAGFNLVLARLRRMMKEHHIVRVETQGQLFDASTMHAIGTMDSPDCPSGHVAEQLSPYYHWRGQVLRFADVRVAN